MRGESARQRAVGGEVDVRSCLIGIVVGDVIRFAVLAQEEMNVCRFERGVNLRFDIVVYCRRSLEAKRAPRIGLWASLPLTSADTAETSWLLVA